MSLGFTFTLALPSSLQRSTSLSCLPLRVSAVFPSIFFNALSIAANKGSSIALTAIGNLVKANLAEEGEHPHLRWVD